MVSDARSGTVQTFLLKRIVSNVRENLTASVLHLAEFVKDDPEKRAMKTMIMKNRMPSDFLLAEKGGVCALVGDYCCTFIPDSTDNITQIIGEVQALQEHLQSQKDDSHWTWDKNLGARNLVPNLHQRK
uniref:Uncharacterized protein n=1 Tax=Cynoglossus semilaevis TaxID=244447 RepID=A0A3P8W015_CYNSE